MYKCRSCHEEYRLTDANLEKMREGKEVNVRCRCGYLDIMVGLEDVPEENASYTYSYRRN